MALTNRDYQIIVRGMLFDEVPCTNVYFHQVDTAGKRADEIAGLFVANFLPDLAPCQSTKFTYLSVEVLNLVDLDDFFTSAAVIPGEVSGECSEPFSAWKFKYLRTTRAVRNGWKALAGVPDSLITDGRANVSADAVLSNAAGVMMSVFDEGTWSLYPCIAQTVKVPLDSDPTKFKYVPVTLHPIDEVVFVRVASQASRHFS